MIRFSLRLPDDLHRQIAALAEAEHRSINEQIVFMISEHPALRRLNAMETEGKHQGAIPTYVRYVADRLGLAVRGTAAVVANVVPDRGSNSRWPYIVLSLGRMDEGVELLKKAAYNPHEGNVTGNWTVIFPDMETARAFRRCLHAPSQAVLHEAFVLEGEHRAIWSEELDHDPVLVPLFRSEDEQGNGAVYIRYRSRPLTPNGQDGGTRDA